MEGVKNVYITARESESESEAKSLLNFDTMILFSNIDRYL